MIADPALRAHISSIQYLGFVRFYCEQGYTLSGPAVVHCDAGGQWSDEFPKCKEVLCASPDVPRGATLVSGAKFSYHYGNVIKYSCEDGYIMQGNHTSICDINGQWTHSAPECK